MKKGILLVIIAVGLVFLVACGPNLEPRVKELESNVSSLQKDKSTLQQEKDKIQAQVTSVEKDKVTLQQEKTSLQQDKDKLQTQTASLTKDKDSLQQDKDKLQAQVTSVTKDKDSALQDKTKLESQNRTLKSLAGPLPASLDNFFPPKAPAPVYLIEMFALDGPFTGTMVDLQEGDIPGAQKNYQAFKSQYAKMSGMVPEWKDLWPTAPVDALGVALASGDPAKVGQAFGGVGEVCGTCHLINMTKAHQKYHWPDFGIIKLTDPVSKQSMSWVDYMFAIAGAYTGIGNDLGQGQLENARKQFDVFSARFKALPTIACVNCHSTPRTYFVDASVTGMVDNLGKELSATAPDPKKVGDLIGAIGNESCMKCHLVHFPAQNSKDRWKTMAEPVVGLTKLDVNAGAPPPAGWKWAVVEFNTGAEESIVPLEDHDMDWVFFVVKGSNEISIGDKKNILNAGEGLVIPATQRHSHRFVPQSKVVAFQLRPADRPPGNLHRGSQILLSENPLGLRPSAAYKLRIREVTLAPGSKIAENMTSNPNFGYVADGVLTISTGNTSSKIEAGKPFTLQTTSTQTVGNDGAAPLRIFLVDIGP